MVDLHSLDPPCEGVQQARVGAQQGGQIHGALRSGGMRRDPPRANTSRPS